MASRTRAGLVSADGEVELATALETSMRRLFGRSLRLRSVVAGSCNGCEAELVALGNVVFDMARFGVQFVASPRHADGLVVTGAVNTNMRRALMEHARRFPGQEKNVYEYFEKTPGALQELRAPIFEDKVIDFVLELAKPAEKKVSRQELIDSLEKVTEA